ncbi:MAG: hypothetical protein KA536_21980 [Saprospiraceae bacterium]|nr:hypothetical protein [Saprospiraceae bacterium]
MKAVDIEAFWKSLDDDQKLFLKEMYNFLVLNEAKDKIIKKLFGKDKPICDLRISVRSYNSLRKHGFKTVAEIKAFGFNNLQSLSGFGPGSVVEIEDEIMRIEKKDL